MTCIGAPTAEKTRRLGRDSHIQEKSHAYADLAG
jgi:uroporphyrinogen-III synthase